MIVYDRISYVVTFTLFSIDLFKVIIGSNLPCALNQRFTELGGESLKALQLVQLIENLVGFRLSDGFEILMTRSLSSFCDYILACKGCKLLHTVEASICTNSPASQLSYEMPIQRSKLYLDFDSTTVVSLQRSNQANVHLDSYGSCFPHHCSRFGSKRMKFSLTWRFDTGKCVDASPLVICDKR